MTNISTCELSYHVNNFDIVYKNGCHNIPPDGLSQISCALTERRISSTVTLLAFVIFPIPRYKMSCIKVSNLSASSNFINPNRETLSKPRNHLKSSMSKASSAYSNIHDKYFLKVVGEESRFPFLFPCHDL